MAERLGDATIGQGEDEREDEAMVVPQTLAPPATREAIAPSGPDRVLDGADEPVLTAGTRVEVRKRLDGEWARGFEVISASDDGYRLRRLSDGGELPLLFSDDDVRKEKKRGTWWY